MVSPAWFAAIVQVPAVTPVTVVPLRVQTPVVVLLKVTELLADPPVAETVPVPPTTTLGAEPKVMLWLPLPTVMFCVTWGAAV